MAIDIPPENCVQAPALTASAALIQAGPGIGGIADIPADYLVDAFILHSDLTNTLQCSYTSAELLSTTPPALLAGSNPH
ncbi:MAG: hypothetical protein AB7G06_00005, partial [Bdellovibrionales bacterium]